MQMMYFAMMWAVPDDVALRANRHTITRDLDAKTVESFKDLQYNGAKKGGGQMIFPFGNYTVEIDVEKTRRTYQRLPLITQRCSCDGCRNFEKAVDGLPEAVRTFFDDLGIDLKRIVECYVNCKNDDGTLLYGGFCHVCGKLLEGKSAWVSVSETHSYYNTALAYQQFSLQVLGFVYETHLCITFRVYIRMSS